MEQIITLILKTIAFHFLLICFDEEIQMIRWEHNDENKQENNFIQIPTSVNARFVDVSLKVDLLRWLVLLVGCRESRIFHMFTPAMQFTLKVGLILDYSASAAFLALVKSREARGLGPSSCVASYFSGNNFLYSSSTKTFLAARPPPGGR